MTAPGLLGSYTAEEEKAVLRKINTVILPLGIIYICLAAPQTFGGFAAYRKPENNARTAL
ncbi:hypothetical protein N7516_007272 [Penicillium verrucosum]|uniref:uncharacterized protein n=1 Tax=Penicillium verrucosum TaxID=60171 RepID=UPI0025451BB4|nr:uncharacterized protein N7516_007272 [Penicillium verrucosum]KAJ5932783.1 hypothetical protein N7516_007272 [Penicillium verrucosum]